MILYNALISLNRKCIVIDIEVPIKEERIQPLALGMIHYVIVFINLYKLNRLLLVQGLMLCYVMKTGLIRLIKKYLKTLIHAIGITESLTMLWIMVFTPYSLYFVH